ncbi:hypothetical protein PIB30_093456 [Stylosanthes scabra]|uniref:Uncharacterized protein n=1 Tax=Stylosanthes scabra TaxID=79078 RepID=A0ABU6RWI7_9FABA|nr:hypothetical protein [Stylosanthes scabra]
MDWASIDQVLGFIELGSQLDRSVQLSHVDRGLIPATSTIRLTVPEKEPKDEYEALKSPLALNDNPVPPVDAVCCIFALLSVMGSSPCFGRSTWGTFLLHVLVIGTWPLWTGSTTFDRSEPYRGLSLSNRRVREVNRRMSSWLALGPGMHHTYLRI